MHRRDLDVGRLSDGDLRTVVESMTDGVLLVDGGGRVRYANPAAAALLGHSEADLLGRELEVDGESVQVEVATEQGARTCELRGSPVMLSGGPALVVSVRDVTDRERARREAESASQAKTGFLNLIVHEIRAPLGVIASALSLLTDETVESNPGRRRFLLDVASDKAKELRQLVEAVLTWARLEAGGLRPDHQLVDLRDVTRAAVERARARAALDSAQVVVDLPKVSVMVEAVPAQIGVVLDNLINNAINYSEGEAWVEVRLERGAAEAEISVADHGIGIAPEQQREIFEAYRRGTGEQVAQRPGTGLGLSIARGLVQLNGGTLELAESSPGAGSRFVLRLPLARARR
jgi:signal transduction histidine kinase